MLTEQLFAAAAIKAFAAELGVVSNNTVAELKALDLGPNSCNNTHGFVA